MKINSSFTTPNVDARTLPIQILVLHYTGMISEEAALQRLCAAESKVSAHYFLRENGEILQLTAEENRAWHAGVSYWDGITNINSASIGIEISNPGHEFGYKPFSDAQITALIPLCQQIIQRHSILPWHVVGHSDIAPNRKQDPGELFPWQYLATQNIGIFPDYPLYSSPLTIKEQRVFLEKLALFGYDCHHEEAAIIAFHRHYCPENITPIPTEKSMLVITHLLNLKIDALSEKS